MKLNETRFTLLVDEPKRMNPKPFHHAITPWDRPIRHDPHDHVHGFRHQGNEVPKGIVRCRCLRDFIMGFRFNCMDEVRKLHRILNEKYRDVVADQIKIAFPGVELDCEPPSVAGEVR